MSAPKWHAYLCRTAAVSFLAIASDSALADVQKARLGMVMWTAFECGTFAEMAGDKERMQALYKHGIEAGRNFLKALRANEITQQELLDHAPYQMLFRLGGDSDDIMIGRMLEAAINNAHDQVVMRGNIDAGDANRPFDAPLSDDLKKSVAQSLHQSSNCDHVVQ